MTNAESERKYFWDTYQEILMENGEPFTLHLYRNADGTFRHYAQLNNYSLNRSVSIDFIPVKGILRYGVYLANDVDLYDVLLEKKELIEKALGFNCIWRHGDTGENARRICCEKAIIKYDHESYLNAIEESMVRLVKFLEVFDRFLRR